MKQKAKEAGNMKRSSMDKIPAHKRGGERKSAASEQEEQTAGQDGQNRIRNWWAGHLKGTGDTVETEQFINKYDPEVKVLSDAAAISEVGGHPFS